MLTGLATYISGYRHLPESPPARATATAAPSEPVQWRVIAALLVVMAITIFQSIAYYQNSNIGLLWIDKYVDLGVLGFHIPVAWFNSIDSFVSIFSVPLLFALWRRQAARGGEPRELGKIATGAWLAAAANLVLVIGCLANDRVPALFPVVYDVILGVAFLYYWPTLLALVSRAAPPHLKATLMGSVFLSLFISNLTIGRLGGFYERMTPAEFWAMNAAIAATGGVVALMLRRRLERVLAAG
jgi:proton-dependent oligopeptide transporter, POT family